ncbi:MAG TPA: hypothetical protein VE988_08495 [Gemmataceae bacterium]|nr:hypothetical protein [Gemmataceae bacterium]
MAAAALTPRVRIMTICDGVRESKTEAGVFHLKGVRQGIVAEAFPFKPSGLWLFLMLSSPQAGEFPGHVRVVNDQTDKTVFFGHLNPNPRFDHAHEMVSGFIRLNCAFPLEGRYTVQIWFFREQEPDVLKGELPFFVESMGV